MRMKDNGGRRTGRDNRKKESGAAQGRTQEGFSPPRAQGQGQRARATWATGA